MKGMGRVRFLASLPAIRQDLADGFPLKAIYRRHQARLGMSYAQFTRYAAAALRAELAAASPLHSAMRRRAGSSPAAPPASPTTARIQDAGHPPSPPGGFHHDPVTRPGEAEDLLGPGFLKRRP